ncbi:urease accessory protein, partial [Lecanoromycetidae sp. Uapishka_2]
MTTRADEQTLKDEIVRLESQLASARIRLSPPLPSNPTNPHPTFPSSQLPSHALLLLSDSALPLGSFAFSSGLESYLAHHSTSPSSQPAPNALSHFLTLTLTSLATTALPYLIAAYNFPDQLQALDFALDACALCPVARRASVAQGKALLTLWDRALKADAGKTHAGQALVDFSKALKNPVSGEDHGLELAGHFPLIWAAVTAALGITLNESAYTFLLNHAKAVVSAAVRASVMGPYAAQGVLASFWLRDEIGRVMQKYWELDVEEAGQGVPMCDVWIGRHELLYSRIFNS